MPHLVRMALLMLLIALVARLVKRIFAPPAPPAPRGREIENAEFEVLDDDKGEPRP
jgi:hypothetical protein